MRVTSIRINREHESKEPLPDGSKLLAMVSIVLDGQLAVTYIRVVELKEGRRIVAMPSRMTAQGMYRDVTYAITEPLREEIKSAVMDEFNGH